jgi:Smg protein
VKENVLEVLMYLFENYMDDDPEFNTDQETLAARLREAGFRRGEINKAFTWLEDLSSMCEETETGAEGGKPLSLRHFAPEESEKLDTAAKGFLLFLEQHGILDATTREMVIDRVMALDTEEFDLEQLKWVVMMILYNQPGRDQAYAWVEDLVYDEIQGHLH